MVNCNPETVSTDYDTSDRLYFEPLTLEDVLEIVELEKPEGVIVQYGGQTPLKLARALEANGVPIIGTSPDSIDLAEDRERFQQLVDELGLKQPPNRTARNPEEALALAREIGYPLVVRPSYVLGGRAMEIVHADADLLALHARRGEGVATTRRCCSTASSTTRSRWTSTCIADSDGNVLIGGVMEHIEEAGVHSGDSSCSLPPYSLSPAIQARLREQVVALAKALNVVGLMNTQFAVQADDERQRHDLPARSQSARLAHRAVRVEGDRRAAGQDRRALHGRQDAGRAGRDQGDRAGLLLGQGSDLPVRQVPGRRPDPRPGDALDRRGDGRGPQLRRRVRARRGSRRASRRRSPARPSSRCAIPTSSACCRWRRTWSRAATRWSPRSGTARFLQRAGPRLRARSTR